MNESVLCRLKRCPYCWVFNETICPEHEADYKDYLIDSYQDDQIEMNSDVGDIYE